MSGSDGKTDRQARRAESDARVAEGVAKAVAKHKAIIENAVADARFTWERAGSFKLYVVQATSPLSLGDKQGEARFISEEKWVVLEDSGDAALEAVRKKARGWEVRLTGELYEAEKARAAKSSIGVPFRISDL